MRRLIAGLAGLTFALTTVVATAQTAPAAPAAAPAPIAAAPGALSVENTTIADLLADAGAHAVLEKDMPQLVAYPGLDQIKGMTLRGISVYPEAQLDDTKLAAIQKDLDAAKK
jgi:hypothetical protein